MILPEEFKAAENGFRLKRDEIKEIELIGLKNIPVVNLGIFHAILCTLGFQCGLRRKSYYHFREVKDKLFVIKHRAYDNGFKLTFFIDKLVLYETEILDPNGLEKTYRNFLPYLIECMNKEL